MSTNEFYSLDDLADLGITVKTTKYADRIFNLSSEEYESLKKSIADNGLSYPITINQNGDVLDGHHRLRACQELQPTTTIEPRFDVKSFDSEAKEEICVYDSNLARRQLNTFQACELALKKKPILALISSVARAGASYAAMKLYCREVKGEEAEKK